MKFWQKLLILPLFVLAACAIPEENISQAPPAHPTDTPIPPTNTPAPTNTPTTVPTETPIPAESPTPAPTIPWQDLQYPEPEQPLDGSDVDVYVDGMYQPVAVAFAPDGRLFYTEKETGHVRVVIDHVLQSQPVVTFPSAILGEQGLLGIAIDPNFETNHYIWVTHVLSDKVNNGEKLNRIIRFTEQNNRAIDIQIAFSSINIIQTDRHNIGNLAFGPDGMLYVAVGEGTEAYLAPNLHDPRGKILRFDPNTLPLQAPPDNPFYDGDGQNFDPIYAYGFRNPFDFVFDPLKPGNIIATGNGPDCDDEVNLVLKGYNYGWEYDYICRDQQPLDPATNTIPPLISWSPTTAPTGITVYTGDDFPEWYGDIFFCAYNNAILHHLKLNEARDAVISHTSINGMFCQIDVINGPDGALYFLEGGGIQEGRLKRLFRKDQ